EDRAEFWPREDDFREEAAADGEDERDDERFDVAEAFILKIHDREDVQRGDADAPDQRNLEQQVERDGRADHFSEVAGANGNFAEQPQRDAHRPGIMITAGLREVAASQDAELRPQRL